MKPLERLASYLDQQYGKPKGVTGWYTGEKMIRQHKKETNWSLEKLDLQRDEHVLEVGCGAGDALRKLAGMATVRHATGIDLSKTLVQSSIRRNKRGMESGKVSIHHGSVQHLPFKSNTFSKIVSIHSIYFWKDSHAAFQELYRVLRPGGSILLTLSDGKDGQTWETVTNRVHEEWVPLLKKLDFIGVDVRRGPSSRGYHIICIVGRK